MLEAVLSQVDWWWSALFRSRVDGLTDEELRWSPVERCWTVHPRDDGWSVIDFHWPPPTPTPFTTIAWRLSHIGLMLARRTTLYFPDHAPEPWDLPPHTYTAPFPMTAEGAVGFVERWWGGWRAGLEAAGDDALLAPYGGVEGSYPEMRLAAEDPFVNMVLHTHRELLHHGAEICLLRDLYLAQQPRDAYVDALLDGDVGALSQLERDEPGIVDRYRAERPDLPLRATELGRVASIGLLAARGFDVSAVVDGRTPLHHAVAGGALDLVRALVEAGADTTVRDAEFDSDPLGWAAFFNQDEIADYLRSTG